MHHIKNKKTRPAYAVLMLVLASLVLAACGSSSSSSTATKAASTTVTGAARTDAVVARVRALRECLAKNGIALPKRTPGQGSPLGGFFGGAAGRQLPSGVSKAQYEAALRKCGALGRRFGGGARLTSPNLKAALATFASCMRAHGVNVPEPNSSGNGPVFDTKGLNTASPAFKAAISKCYANLRSVLGARPGAGGAPSTGAGPPAAG